MVGRGSEAGASRAVPGIVLSGLVPLLPFEPRTPALAVLGLHFTPLECVAALAGALLLVSLRGRLAALLARPPLPLLGVTAFAATQALSAFAASDHRAECARFALRMGAMAAFAWLFAACDGPARRRALLALVAVAGLLSLLAALEGSGLRLLDPLLDCFRDTHFTVGGARRATAGTAYPTLAAAWIGSGLVVAAALAREWPRPLASAVLAALALTPGVLWTYSRGPLIAALAGLAAVAGAGWRAHERVAGTAALAAAATAAAGALLFAAGGEIFRLRLASEGTTAWYRAVYAPGETFLRLQPHESRRLDVRVLNSGLKAWRADEGFALSYHWFDPVRRRLADGPRTALPRVLERGMAEALRPVVEAPGDEGCYLLVWDMVHEHTTWFSAQGVPPAAVPAVIGGGDGERCARASAPAAALGGQPGRRELWTAAAAMWRDHPLTGVGPDNFRRLYGRYAGRAFWDTRVSANNLLLETAATSGTLGAAALAATLLLAAVASARAAVRAPSDRAAAAAVLGLVVLCAVHGAVDYVLAFTGPYLLFALTIGCAAALEDEAGGAGAAA